MLSLSKILFQHKSLSVLPCVGAFVTALFSPRRRTAVARAACYFSPITPITPMDEGSPRLGTAPKELRRTTERAREQNSKAHSHPAHNHLRSCQGRAHALPEICRKTAEWPRALKHYDAPPLAVRTQSVARELAVPVGLSPPAECL